MADEPNATPEGEAQLDLDVLTPEEQAYKDTRGGEKEVKAEVKTEAKPESSEEKPAKDDRKVDYGALAEERGKRKEAEERVRKAELLAARMEERFRAYTQPQQQPQRPPTPDEDIFGAVNHLVQRQQRTEAEFNRVRQQQAAAQQQQKITEWATTTEVEFHKEHPDYYDAVNHLRAGREAELKNFGYNPAHIKQTIQQDEIALVVQAGRAGKSPAELAYQIAKQRGYTAKSPPADDVNQKLDRIEAGQKASGTLSNVGGAPGGGDVTLKMLVDMPEEEFAAWTAKNPAKYRRLRGSPS